MTVADVEFYAPDEEDAFPPLPDDLPDLDLSDLDNNPEDDEVDAAAVQPSPNGSAPHPTIAKPVHTPSPARGGLIATPLAGVTMRSIEWLERPLWQSAAFQLLAAPKGAGKGTYLAGLASRISNSGANVLFVSSEDSTSIDLKPRLVAAGANISRCYVIQQSVMLPDDVPKLHALALSLGGVGMLVIDPVANHIGPVKPGDDVKVRHAIAPLNVLADELACLVIGVRHPGKDRSRGAVASILGSTAWTDTPRAVVMIAVDDQDPLIRHIQVVVGNRSLNGSAHAFRIDAVQVEDLKEHITLAVDLGESSKSVDELLSLIPRIRKDTKTEHARDLILNILEDEPGEHDSTTVDQRVTTEIGISPNTVRNIRTKLKGEKLIKIRPEKDADGEITGWKVSRTTEPRP